MKMPFEKLMGHVSSLGEENAALTLAALSHRWGEPVQRIADAIDAVRVMNGEHTYIPVGVAEAEPEPCRGFRWIGQSFASCDGCGKPAWEHEGEMRPRVGATIVGGAADWELRLWTPGEAEAIKRKWGGS